MQLITGATGEGFRFAVIAQQEDENDDPINLWTIGFWADGEWSSELDLHFNPISVQSLPSGEDNWVVLGSNNEVLWINSATTAPTSRVSHVDGGDPVSFTSLCCYHSGVAAAQLGRKVFWSSGGVWSPLGVGLPEAFGGRIAGFEAMAVLDDQLYGVGWKGEIWYLLNDRWYRLDSPVNTILTSVVSVGDEIIACGRLGVVLKGQADRWQVINHDQTDEDFWSVVNFRDMIFISSMTGIYELKGDALIPVDDDSKVGSYYHLAANSEVLLSVGTRGAMIFDGSSWYTVF